MSSIINSAVVHQCPFALPTHKCYELGCTRSVGDSEPTCVIKLRTEPEESQEHSDSYCFVQVCAWCGKVLNVQVISRPARHLHSHGICQTCRDKLMEQRRKPN